MRLLISTIIFVVRFSGLSGFNLECEFSDVECYFGYAAPGQTCEAKNLTVKNEYQNITSINGQFAEYYRNANVRKLIVQWQTLYYMPNGLANFFPDLEEIYISGSELRSIKKKDIEPFTKLLSFWGYDNKIEELDDNLFESNKAIKGLFFSNNPLKYIGMNTLDPLTNLEKAYFNNIICIFEQAVNKDQVPALKEKIKAHCIKPKYCDLPTAFEKVKGFFGLGTQSDCIAKEN